MSAQSARISSSDNGIVPGISPQVYSRSDFDRIAKLVRVEAGIVLDNSKRMLAYSRIAPLVRASGATRFKDYLDRLEHDAPAKTRTIASLTTNHTYFYREPHHFEHFAQHVRPQLIDKAERGEPVRLWSAGSSSGEEIWTLIMVLLGEDRFAGQKIAAGDIIALASDLADHAIAAAERAIYPAEALSPIPEALRNNWCETADLALGDTARDELAIGQTPRKLVRFRQLNLLRSWPFSSSFDVIFCRNVMIYFDGPSKEQLLLAFARHLRPGGYLYIGHSERVSGEAANLIEQVGPTIYQRRDI